MKKSTTKKPSKANSGHKNLIPGKKPEAAPLLSSKIDTFLIWYKITGDKTQACDKAGMSRSWANHVLSLPRVQDRIPLIEERLINKVIDKALKEIEVTVSKVDKNLLRVMNSQPHERRGFADVLGAVKTGYVRTGVIDNRSQVNVSANAGAQAGAQTGIQNPNAFEVYKSKWQRDKESGWDRQLAEQNEQSSANS